MSSWNVYLDGASRSNPGESGCGVYMSDSNNVICAYKYLGITTNNQAEYNALLYALDILLNKGYNVYNIQFYTDSLLVCNQINRKWACKNHGLQQLFGQCYDKLNKLKSWSMQHIKREFNTHADKLANMAIDTKSVSVKIL